LDEFVCHTLNEIYNKLGQKDIVHDILNVW